MEINTETSFFDITQQYFNLETKYIESKNAYINAWKKRIEYAVQSKLNQFKKEIGAFITIQGNVELIEINVKGNDTSFLKDGNFSNMLNELHESEIKMNVKYIVQLKHKIKKITGVGSYHYHEQIYNLDKNVLYGVFSNLEDAKDAALLCKLIKTLRTVYMDDGKHLMYSLKDKKWYIVNYNYSSASYFRDLNNNRIKSEYISPSECTKQYIVLPITALQLILNFEDVFTILSK